MPVNAFRLGFVVLGLIMELALGPTARGQSGSESSGGATAVYCPSHESRPIYQLLDVAEGLYGSDPRALPSTIKGLTVAQLTGAVLDRVRTVDSKLASDLQKQLDFVRGEGQNPITIEYVSHKEMPPVADVSWVEQGAVPDGCVLVPLAYMNDVSTTLRKNREILDLLPAIEVFATDLHEGIYRWARSNRDDESSRLARQAVMATLRSLSEGPDGDSELKTAVGKLNHLRRKKTWGPIQSLNRDSKTIINNKDKFVFRWSALGLAEQGFSKWCSSEPGFYLYVEICRTDTSNSYCEEVAEFSSQTIRLGKIRRFSDEIEVSGKKLNQIITKVSGKYKFDDTASPSYFRFTLRESFRFAKLFSYCGVYFRFPAITRESLSAVLSFEKSALNLVVLGEASPFKEVVGMSEERLAKELAYRGLKNPLEGSSTYLTTDLGLHAEVQIEKVDTEKTKTPGR